MLYALLKPVLFKMQPEDAHDFVLKVASLCPTLGTLSGITPDPRLHIQVGSIEWTFPVGLAAGLDKNAEALDFFSAQGFGAVECGTVTLAAQLGNPKPRMFRYPTEESLRNSMGFPSKGLLAVMPNLRAYDGPAPIGANIGKNKDSNRTESINELCLMYESLEADYFVVNVSSPNTPGLREFQEPGYLRELFTEILKLKKTYGKDVYLKIAPDLEVTKVVELTHFVEQMGITGIIATNTTVIPERGVGGMSGKILTEKAAAIRKLILQHTQQLELIGVGGFSSPRDLFRFWYDGGKAAQVYTSYIFQGPGLLKEFQREILSVLQKSDLGSLNAFFQLPLSERRSLLTEHSSLRSSER